MLYYLNIFFKEIFNNMCNFANCNSKSKKYGNYCHKHKREYLIKDDIILISNFTGRCSDYLKKDLVNTINYRANYKNTKGKNKEELFIFLKELIEKIKEYDENDITKIKKIQGFFRNKKYEKINCFRGEGFLNKDKVNNETDFFTYDTIEEIDEKYYFSYKDEKQFIWFFDIRSFNKLIELKQPNPYTMKEIPSEAISNAKKLTELLNLSKKDELIDKKQIKISRKQMIKQKCIDLFCDIETTTMYCNPQWFFNLHLNNLKRLYRNLEDLWNYRLEISNEIKSRISPPNGLVFTTRVSEVNQIQNKYDIQELLINEINKFQNAITPEDKKMGYTYFMIGLVSVSRECYETHPFLVV